MIIFYTDCMSIAPTDVGESQLYPQLAMSCIDDDYKVISKSGATTKESVEKFEYILELNPKKIIYSFGVNDALPRGLKRQTRSKIIRFMYTIKMSEKQRLIFRKSILNPLEFFLGIFFRDRHYVNLVDFEMNIEYIVNQCLSNDIEIILLNIAPVKNYRFVNSKKHIINYNVVINKIVEKYSLKFINVFDEFCKEGEIKSLAEDRFHYGLRGHELVAKKLIRILR